MVRPIAMFVGLAACTPSPAPVLLAPPKVIVYPAPPPLLVTAPHTKSLDAFVSEASPVVVLQHVHLIDGTGGPGKDDQSIVVANGKIAAVGPTASVAIPSGAKVLDLAGRTVFPGLVDMHGHLFYGQLTRPPITDVTFAEQAISFPRLYLAAGVTTARTTGSLEPYADLAVKRRIDSGELAGPHLALTAPYLSGADEPIMQMARLGEVEQVNRFVTFWLDAGFTSLKAYMHLTRAQLGAAIKAAHSRGVKITGHLCAVTFLEAADLGIDNLEHGLETDTDLVDGKKPDDCPEGGAFDKVDIDGPAVRAIIAKLVARHVAVTSTLAILEPFVRSDTVAVDPRALAVMNPTTRSNVEMFHAMLAKRPSPALLKEMAFERAFVKAGGVLLAGSDPSGFGAVVAGFGSQREVELLVEAGFTAIEAIQIATSNGARFLGADREIGTIEVGKRADLVVVTGNPEHRIADLEQVEVVFKDGVGYDPAKLIASVTGTVGLN